MVNAGGSGGETVIKRGKGTTVSEVVKWRLQVLFRVVGCAGMVNWVGVDGAECEWRCVCGSKLWEVRDCW